MKILIIANCQYMGLVEYFKLIIGKNNINFVPLNIINNTEQFNKYSQHAKANIENYDIILTFYINHDRFDFWKTENIKSLYPDKTYIIDNIYFAGLHPDAVCVGDIFNRLKSPLEIYHSKIILHSFVKGLTEQECLEKFNYDEYKRLGYFDIYEQSAKELLERNKRCDIGFAQEFLGLVKKEHSLFIFNHPTSYIFYHFGKKICKELGIKTEEFPHQLLINPLSDHIWWSVYPEISDYHRLSYKTPIFFKKADGYNGVMMSLEDFIRESYQMYNEKKEEILSLEEVKILINQMDNQISESKMFSSKDIISQFYLGFFDRNPDQSGYAFYLNKINKDELILSDLIKIFANSEEFKSKSKLVKNDELIKQLYLGLLNRMPDSSGYQALQNNLQTGSSISDIIKSIINSQEFLMKSHDRPHHMLYGGHIAYAYENPATVFIHIPKTAGQSLHWLFKQKVGENKVSPLFNNLYLLPANFSYTYDVIFGHTDYETVRLLVQRKEVKLVTFLRDPIKRLISLYKFWWSHDPEFHKGNTAVELANKYSIEEFFRAEEVRKLLWNDMFGRFMGYKLRDTLKDALEESFKDENKRMSFLNKRVIPLIHEQIEEYFYIGLQEQFNQDVCEMFNRLGFSCDDVDLQDAKVNITENNIGKPGFKKEKPSFDVNETVLSAIEELTELDNLLYQQVKNIRSEQENKILGGESGNPLFFKREMKATICS